MLSNISFRRKKTVPFPILKEENGVSYLLSKEPVYNYKLTPPDLSTLSFDDGAEVSASLASFLNTLSVNDWLKFSRFDNQEIFVSCNRPLEGLPFSKIEPNENATTSTFGGEYPISDIEFESGYIEFGGNIWSIVNADTPPNTSFLSFLDSYGEDYVASIRKIDAKIAIKELSFRRKRQGVATATLHKNHEGEKAYEEIDKFLEDLEIGNESIFKGQIWFLIKGHSRHEVKSRAKSLIDTLRNEGVSAYMEIKRLEYWFSHLINGVSPCKLREFPIGASYASNMIPFNYEHLHDEGFSLLGERYPVKLNLFDASFTNNHSLITGATGEGKSVLVGSMAYHFHTEQDANLAIFDLGGSFNRLCNFLGGTKLNYAMNPLQFKEPIFLYSFIMSVVGEDELSKIQKNQLYGYLKEFCAEEDPPTNNFIEFLTLLDVNFNLRDYFHEIEEFLTDEIQDTPRVFYLDIKNLPESVILPFLVYANRLSESTDKRVVKIFDECWAFMDKCPSILRTIVKTGRKENVASIFLTQELKDFFNDHSEVANAITGNTYNKIYFHQGSGLDHASIPDGVKSFMRGVKSDKNKFSKFLYTNPNTKKVLTFEANKFEWQLMHTEKKHLKSQEDFLKEHTKYLSYQDAFMKWVDYAK